MRKIVYLILFSFVFFGHGQMTSQDVLEKIASLQIESDEFYDPGLFSVQRTWNLSKDPAEDNTIFFTASVVHTLSGLATSMDFASKTLIDSIAVKATANYDRYASRQQEPTFNFWQTVGPDLPFPNGNRWISNTKMRLPDDLDTSVILAMSSGDEELKSRLREKMGTYAAREERAEAKRQTLEKYETSLAYEAWFAKDMPQTFDICVMSNALLFVLEEGYPLQQYDLATADLIKRIIFTSDLEEHLDDVSHHTTSKAVIYYHVARLLEKDHDGLFQDLRPVVADELITLQHASVSEVERMLAHTSLLRLGIFPSETLDQTNLEAELSDFVFFSVKPFLGSPQLAFLEAIVPDISWKCEAYNWTLYLEYMQLKRTYTTNVFGTR